MDRERDEGGKYLAEISVDDVLQVFERVEIPVLTASEIADELDCARPTAYNKLEGLTEGGKLRKKKVGSRAAVYIYPERLLEGADD